MTQRGPSVEFALVVELGPLEAQARLLVESLRTFGGRHAAAEVTAVSPRARRRPARSTVRALRRLGATYLELDVDGACPAYPTSWRTHSLAVLERRDGPDVLVQLDSDTVFLADVGPLCADARAQARPVDVKGMGSTGPDDDYEPYWRALCRLAGLAVDDLPWVETTVDHARVRATHNGGFVAARRELGLFGAAERLFRRSVEADLRPHAGRGDRVTAGHGEVGKDGSEWWGSAQSVVAVAAASLGVEIAALSLSANVPMHSWAQLDPKPEPIAHAHYHWLLGDPAVDPVPDPNPMLDPAVVGERQAPWLAERSPLVPVVSRRAVAGAAREPGRLRRRAN